MVKGHIKYTLKMSLFQPYSETIVLFFSDIFLFICPYHYRIQNVLDQSAKIRHVYYFVISTSYVASLSKYCNNFFLALHNSLCSMFKLKDKLC